MLAAQHGVSRQMCYWACSFFDKRHLDGAAGQHSEAAAAFIFARPFPHPNTAACQYAPPAICHCSVQRFGAAARCLGRTRAPRCTWRSCLLWPTAAWCRYACCIPSCPLVFALHMRPPASLLIACASTVEAAARGAASSQLPQALFWPFSGIQLPFVGAALPLVLLLPLASSRRLCLRLLDEDTAAEPLVLLHSLIGAAQ